MNTKITLAIGALAIAFAMQGVSAEVNKVSNNRESRSEHIASPTPSHKDMGRGVRATSTATSTEKNMPMHKDMKDMAKKGTSTMPMPRHDMASSTASSSKIMTGKKQKGMIMKDTKKNISSTTPHVAQPVVR